MFLTKDLKINLTIGFGVLTLLFSAPFSFAFTDLRDQWLESVSAIETADSYDSNISTIQLKIKLREEEWQNRKIYFSDIVDRYLNQELDIPPVINDLNQMKESESYFNSLTNLILSKSLNKIKNSKIPQIISLMQIYKKSYSENAIPLFLLTGESINRPSPIIEKGGFHFDKQSIFTDITRTQNNEFLFIFLHELYHVLDDELYTSTELFTNKDTLTEMKNLANEFSSLSALTPEQQNKLQIWISAGLNRHLFAEWRAWFFCFSVYQKGLHEKLWSKIPFIEEIIAQKPQAETLASFLYRYLNTRGRDLEPFLQQPLFSDIINKLRSEFIPQTQKTFPSLEENSIETSSQPSPLDRFFSIFRSQEGN
jgi:hypothetical protein